MKYILVTWPECQQFMGCTNAHFCMDEKLPDSSYFVEEELYNAGCKTGLYGEELEDYYLGIEE